MKITQTLAFVTASPLFFIGIGMIGIFSVISYNQKNIEYVAIIIGGAFAVIGWTLARYAAKGTGESTFDVLLEIWP